MRARRHDLVVKRDCSGRLAPSDMDLRSGDLIITGPPDGVGPRLIGDELEGGIGRSRNDQSQDYRDYEYKTHTVDAILTPFSRFAVVIDHK